MNFHSSSTIYVYVSKHVALVMRIIKEKTNMDNINQKSLF